MNSSESQTKEFGFFDGCPDLETLHAFLKSELKGLEDDWVGSHLETCESCRDQLEHLDQIGWQKLEQSITLLRCDNLSQTKIDGFEIKDCVGQGGQGVVYRAFEKHLERWVAIKVLRNTVVKDGKKRVDLFREARATARLNHHHIVQVLSVHTSGEIPALVLEWMDGGTLADRINDGQKLTNEVIVDLMIAISDAVSYAHANGILHRDIKPSNILFLDDTFGKPKLNDFGLAKIQSDSGEWSSTREMVGTPHYMACEAISRNHGEVGTHSDIYSLGAVLYHLLTGRTPFAAESPMESIYMAIHHDLIPPGVLRPKTPKDLETICLKCLEKIPHRRYRSAAEVRDDLIRFRENRPILARRPGHWQRFSSLVYRYPSQSILIMLFLITAAMSLIIISIRYRNEADLNNRLSSQLVTVTQKNRQVEELNRNLQHAIHEKNRHFQDSQNRLSETRQAIAHLTPLAKRVFDELSVNQGELRELDRISDLLESVGFESSDVVEEVDTLVAILELADVMRGLENFERSKKLAQLALKNLEQVFRHRGDELDVANYYNYVQLNIARCYTSLYHAENNLNGLAKFTEEMAYFLDQSIKNTEGVILRSPKSIESFGLKGAMVLEQGLWKWHLGDLDQANRLFSQASEQHWEVLDRNPDNRYRYLFLSCMLKHEFQFLSKDPKNDQKILETEERLFQLVEKTKNKFPDGWQPLVIKLLESKPLTYRFLISRGQYENAIRSLDRHIRVFKETECLDHHTEIQFIMEKAVCLKFLDDQAGFEKIMNELNKMIVNIDFQDEINNPWLNRTLMVYYTFAPELKYRNLGKAQPHLVKSIAKWKNDKHLKWVLLLKSMNKKSLNDIENELVKLDQSAIPIFYRDSSTLPLRLAYIEYMINHGDLPKISDQLARCYEIIMNDSLADPIYQLEFKRLVNLSKKTGSSDIDFRSL